MRAARIASAAAIGDLHTPHRIAACPRFAQVRLEHLFLAVLRFIKALT